MGYTVKKMVVLALTIVCVFLQVIVKTPSFEEVVPMNITLAVIVAKV